MHRRYYNIEIQDYDDGYSSYRNEVRVEVGTLQEATVIGSQTGSTGVHLPVLDLDFPCTLVPSRTTGHFHLYLERPMGWLKYKRLLRALWKAGIIERGYYKMAVKRGQTFVRKPEMTVPFDTWEPSFLIYEGGGSQLVPRRAPTFVTRISKK